MGGLHEGDERLATEAIAAVSDGDGIARDHHVRELLGQRDADEPIRDGIGQIGGVHDGRVTFAELKARPEIDALPNMGAGSFGASRTVGRLAQCIRDILVLASVERCRGEESAAAGRPVGGRELCDPLGV